MTVDLLMKLRCRRVRGQTTAFVDGEVSPAQAARMERHYERCVPCREYRDDIRMAVAEQESLLREAVEYGAIRQQDVSGALRRLRATMAPVDHLAGTRPSWPAVACGAAACAGLAVFLWLRENPGQAPAGPNAVPQATTLASVPARAPARDAASPSLARASDSRRGLASNHQRRPSPVPVSSGEAPEAVLERPDLFRDYRFFERLEALEHFDTVRSMLLEGHEQREAQG